MTEAANPLIDIYDVAEFLGVSVNTVRKLVRSGGIPLPLRVGKSMRWQPEVLREWLDAGCPACTDDDEENVEPPTEQPAEVNSATEQPAAKRESWDGPMAKQQPQAPQRVEPQPTARPRETRPAVTVIEL